MDIIRNLSIFDLDINIIIGILKISTVTYPYTKNLLFEEEFKIKDITMLYVELEKKKDCFIEISLFKKGIEHEYDEKINGGRFVINILKDKNNIKNKNFNLFLKKIKIKQTELKLTTKIFLSFLIFILINIIIDTKDFKSDNIFICFITSIEGITFITDQKCDKIIISFNKNYNQDELKSIAILLKSCLYLYPTTTIKYNNFNDMTQNFFF